MGVLGSFLIKGASTVARNATIKAVEVATVNIIDASSKNRENVEDLAVKNGTMLIAPTRTSEDYHYKDAIEIVRELLGIGFNNIELKSINELSKRQYKEYGKIRSIQINGKNRFAGVKKSRHHLIF